MVRPRKVLESDVAAGESSIEPASVLNGASSLTQSVR